MSEEATPTSEVQETVENTEQVTPQSDDIELEIEDWLWIIRELVSEGFPAFRLTGGEPTLIGRANLKKIVNEITNHPSVEFKFASNGYALAKHLDIFKEPIIISKDK